MTGTTIVDEGAGLWLTITELAERDGVGKPAISERVARLEREGLLTTRPGKGRTKLVNAAEFDRAVGQGADLGRVQGAATRRLTAEAAEAPPPPPMPGTDPVYTREQARKMAYAADLAKLDLDERLGRVVPVDALTTAVLQAGETLARQIDRLPQRADDIATAVGTDGTAGARRVLKEIGTELRRRIADDLGKLTDQAGLADPPGEGASA